jgi:prepilin-type processing-associated H-X9-DG protein
MASPCGARREASISRLEKGAQMRKVVGLIVLSILTLVVSLGPCIFLRARQLQLLDLCTNNLKQLGNGLYCYHDHFGRFPLGAVPNKELSPERRLSWQLGTWPYIGDGQVRLLIDMTKSWDSEENYRPTEWRDADGNGSILDIVNLRCPANFGEKDLNKPQDTHYVGVTGIGSESSSLPAYYPLTGFFGYERQTELKNIYGPASSTMMVIETKVDNGPWIAAGRPTLRGLEPSKPYLGHEGQFATNHYYDSVIFGASFPVKTNVLFADGSVRSLTQSMNAEVFEAMSTVGGEGRHDSMH